MPESKTLEEEVFGPHWKTAVCRPAEAQAYFNKRFGLGRTAYYEILSKRLMRTQLAAPKKKGRTKGLSLFCLHVVEACDRLAEEAMARAKAAAAGDVSLSPEKEG